MTNVFDISDVEYDVLMHMQHLLYIQKELPLLPTHQLQVDFLYDEFTQFILKAKEQDLPSEKQQEIITLYEELVGNKMQL